MGNGEWGMGNGEWGMGSILAGSILAGSILAGSREHSSRGMGVLERNFSPMPPSPLLLQPNAQCPMPNSLLPIPYYQLLSQPLEG
jgi:hypothetical protein